MKSARTRLQPDSPPHGDTHCVNRDDREHREAHVEHHEVHPHPDPCVCDKPAQRDKAQHAEDRRLTNGRLHTHEEIQQRPAQRPWRENKGRDRPSRCTHTPYSASHVRREIVHQL